MTSVRFGLKMPSRPGEFHPESLTDPDVILSHHPARATARRLPPSAERSGSSRFNPVGPCSTAMTCPLCSAGITPLRCYYEAVRPSPAHRYFRPRGWSRLCLSLDIAGQVLTFRTRAWLSFAPSTCRMPLGPSQASPKLIPEEGSPPGFDIGVQPVTKTGSALLLSHRRRWVKPHACIPLAPAFPHGRARCKRQALLFFGSFSGLRGARRPAGRAGEVLSRDRVQAQRLPPEERSGR